MSKGPDEVTSTTSTEPPEFIRGPLTTAVNAAESAFLKRGGVQGPGIVPNRGGMPGRGGPGHGGPGRFPRNLPFQGPSGGILPPTSIPGTSVPPSSSGAPGLIEQGQGLIGSTLSGDFLNPGSNPYLEQTFNRAADLTRTRLSSEFAGSGRDLGAAAPARSEELQTLASNIFGGNYQAERDRQIAALGQGLEFDPLNLFINRLAGIIPGAGGTTTATQPVYQTGIFSDRRLKRNIQRMGEKNGYPWYSFEYIWGEKAEGYMADELPSEFVGSAFGFATVDYARVK